MFRLKKRRKEKTTSAGGGYIYWWRLIRISTDWFFGFIPFPRVSVPGSLKRYIKWVLRGLTVIGVTTSVVTFPSPLAALLFSLLLLGVEQFFERFVFLSALFYVQPMPSFAWKPELWHGMGYAFPADSTNPALLNVVGPAFQSQDYARQFFDLMRVWNNHQREDLVDNIRLSFVVDKNSYTVHIYPDPNRHNVTEFFEEFGKGRKDVERFVVQMDFAKTFPLRENSMFLQFLEKQRADQPFWFQPFLWKDEANVDIIYDINPILKFRFEVIQKSELSARRPEFRSGRWARLMAIRVKRGC